ncbi:hypothetical protein [Chryseobacterium taeanense]|uniref:hypothetical protein n=1 Tax=Chryseobacterium taeanense TaxID=311334 RepID=UPI0035B0BD40
MQHYKCLTNHSVKVIEEPEVNRRPALHWKSWWLSGVEATIEWESLKRHKNSPQWRGGENSG